MARMHSRGKGRSGSKRPPSKVPPSWVNADPKGVESLVVELAKKGNPPSVIGMILRDQYGIPSVRAVTGKKIVKILREHGIAPEIPEDLMALMKRAVRVKKHLERNRKDMHNKVALIHIESKIRRLVDYYKEKGVLPADWKYSIETAEVMVR